MKRILIQILLLAAAGVLVYLVWDTIQDPIRFEKEKEARYAPTIQKLKDIRKAQIAYKDVNERFAGDWEKLINFVKTDSLPQIRKIGMLTDSMVAEGLTEKDALRQGLIIRDTVKVSVLESLFGSDYPIDDLMIIPNSGGEKFTIDETILITGSGVAVPVFESKAHNKQILKELYPDYEQLIINLNEQRRANELYPGLKVGSTENPNNNAGNWE